MKLPVFKAFFAGLALFFGKAGELFKALWLPALLMMAALAFIMPRYLGVMVDMTAMDSETDPAAVFAAMGPMLKYIGLLYLTMAIVYPIMIAGNLKYIIRGQELRLPFYLQFGLDELRILITFILLGLMFAIVYVVGALCLIVLSTISAMVTPQIAGVVIAVAALALAITLVWFLLRLSLALPAAVGARKIGIAESWRLTEGNAWRLFFYWFFWLIVLLVVAAVYLAVSFSEFFSLLPEMVAAAGQDSSASREIEQRMLEMEQDQWDMSKPGFWVYAGGTYLYTLVYTGLWNVAGGVAYRYLSDGQPSQ